MYFFLNLIYLSPGLTPLVKNQETKLVTPRSLISLTGLFLDVVFEESISQNYYVLPSLGPREGLPGGISFLDLRERKII